jgi:hypothetical protein
LNNKTALCLLAGSVWVLGAAACSDSDSPSEGSGAAGSGGSSAGTNSSGGKGGKGGSTGGSSSSGGKGGSSGQTTGSGGTKAGSSNAGTGGSDETGGTAGSPDGSAGESPGVGGDDGIGEGGGGGEELDPNAPVLEYHFDEGEGTVVVDDSERALDATLTDATAWSTEGRNGNALSLAGGATPTQFVEMPSGVFTGLNEATIATWVKLDTNPLWHRIFDFGNQGAGTDTRFMYLTPNSPAGIRLSVFGGAAENEATVTTGTTLPTGVWKHVAATIAANGEHSIYVDGFPAAKVSSVIVPPSQMEPISPLGWLGKSRFPDAGLDGLMDEFVVYGRVLTPAELADLAWPKADFSRLRFDEATGDDSVDSSDRGIDATLHGAAWSSGRLGAAVQLSGEEQYVSLASDPLGGCTTELTLALWVKLGAGTQWARLLDFGNAENFMFFTARGGANELRFVMFTPEAETALSSNTSVPLDNTWHHVAAVVSPSALTLYLDGASVGNLPDPVVTPGDLGVLTENFIGKSRFPADPYLNAAVDELRISCRAFTADEIKNLAFK